MAIKYGKGLRGALGRMRDVEQQYVGLPYKEMMAGNLMRQAAYDKGQETIDTIDSLYNQPVLQKDRDILDQKESGFNTKLSEQIESVGGDIGKLSGFLTSQLRQTATDPTYSRAIQSKTNFDEYYTQVMGASIDQPMKNFYINKALNNYQGADQGVFRGQPFSEVTAQDIQKDLAAHAKNLYSTAPKQEREIDVLVEEATGKSYTNPEVIEKYLENPIEGYSIKKQQVTQTQRTPKEIQKSLFKYATNAYGSSIQDMAEAMGIDSDVYMQKIVNPLANTFFRNDISMGQIYNTPSSSSDSDKDEESGKDLSLRRGIGLPIENKGLAMLDNLVENVTDPTTLVEEITKMRDANEISNIDASILTSAVDAAVAKTTDAFGGRIPDMEESLQRAMGDNPLKEYFTDEEGKVDMEKLKTNVFFGNSAWIGGVAEEDRDGVINLRDELREVQKNVEDKTEEINKQFKQIIKDMVRTEPQAQIIDLSDTQAGKTNIAAKTILSNPDLAVEVYQILEGNKIERLNSKQMANIYDEDSSAVITGYQRYPQTEASGTFRTLNIEHKKGRNNNVNTKSYKVKMPEEQFQSMFTQGELNIQEGVDEKYLDYKGIDAEPVSRIAAAPITGMHSVLPQIEDSIEAAIDEESITGNADVSARIVKETVGLRIEVQVITEDGVKLDVVENVPTRSVAGKYISTLPQILLKQYLEDKKNKVSLEK